MAKMTAQEALVWIATNHGTAPEKTAHITHAFELLVKSPDYLADLAQKDPLALQQRIQDCADAAGWFRELADVTDAAADCAETALNTLEPHTPSQH